MSYASRLGWLTLYFQKEKSITIIADAYQKLFSTNKTKLIALKKINIQE